MQTTWKHSGGWINRRANSIWLPCCAIPSQHWNNYPMLAHGSAATSPQGLTPLSHDWKSPRARNSIRLRPTTWSQVAIPKSVKHPPVNISVNILADRPQKTMACPTQLLLRSSIYRQTYYG